MAFFNANSHSDVRMASPKSSVKRSGLLVASMTFLAGNITNPIALCSARSILRGAGRNILSMDHLNNNKQFLATKKNPKVARFANVVNHLFEWNPKSDVGGSKYALEKLLNKHCPEKWHYTGGYAVYLHTKTRIGKGYDDLDIVHQKSCGPALREAIYGQTDAGAAEHMPSMRDEFGDHMVSLLPTYRPPQAFFGVEVKGTARVLSKQVLAGNYMEKIALKYRVGKSTGLFKALGKGATKKEIIAGMCKCFRGEGDYTAELDNYDDLKKDVKRLRRVWALKGAEAPEGADIVDFKDPCAEVA